mgnify:CR=1 FL=1
MSYKLPDEPSTQESLQCLACAGNQEINNFGYEDMQKLMLGTHEKQSAVERFAGIDWSKMRPRFVEFASDPAKPDELEAWINSSIWVAESLESSQYLSGGGYMFYRQDQFPGNGTLKSFKDVFNVLKKNIKKAVSKDPKFGRGTAGKIYSQLTLSDDKWNPADIVAVKSSKVRMWESAMKAYAAGSRPKKTTFKDDLSAFAQKLQKQPGKLEKLDIVPAMQDLYEYNKMIFRGIQSKTFVPISLKKATKDRPPVQAIIVKEPADLEKYFHIKIDVSKFNYNVNNQKAQIYFSISNFPGKSGDYFLDARGFESTNKMADIQVQLQQPKSAANHGKITLPVATLVAKESGAKRAFSKMHMKRKQLFKDTEQKDLRRKMYSGIHGFTDYRIFDEYARNKKLSTSVGDVQAWGEYVEFLSSGATKAKDFVKNATGQKFYTESAQKKHKLDVGFTQAKYMKNKVQSYEYAYVLDPRGAGLGRELRDNLLKSMWMYAASQGFAIFNQNASTTFLLSGSYIKCAA